LCCCAAAGNKKQSEKVYIAVIAALFMAVALTFIVERLADA
jgi:hypothetical protein